MKTHVTLVVDQLRPAFRCTSCFPEQIVFVVAIAVISVGAILFTLIGCYITINFLEEEPVNKCEMSSLIFSI